MALSDIHLGTAVKTVDLKQLVTQAEKIKPDMIFLVGDVYDENTSSDEIDDFFSVHVDPFDSRHHSMPNAAWGRARPSTLKFTLVS